MARKGQDPRLGEQDFDSAGPAREPGLRASDQAAAPSEGLRSKDRRIEEGETLPLYLTRFSYTPETWARLIKKPEDRRAAAQQYIESVGGRLHGFWYAFGDHDGYNLWEAPDNVSMAAVAVAIGAGGALSSIETTVLLSVEDTLAALEKAQSIKYKPPGS
jgi:uncharacterized protein with GYD domain